MRSSTTERAKRLGSRGRFGVLAREGMVEFKHGVAGRWPTLAPDDAVWTISERTYQRSAFSKEQITWASERVHGTNENIRALLKKYPHPSGNPIATARTIQGLLEKLSS